MKIQDENQSNLTMITNELHEVKMHLCNDRAFEGGFALGSLYSNVANRLLGIENKEYHEDDEEEEVVCPDCEDKDEKIDAQRIELYTLRNDKKDTIYFETRLNAIKEYLIKLLNDYQIYPAQRTETIEFLSNILDIPLDKFYPPIGHKIKV